MKRKRKGDEQDKREKERETMGGERKKDERDGEQERAKECRGRIGPSSPSFTGNGNVTRCWSVRAIVDRDTACLYACSMHIDTKREREKERGKERKKCKKREESERRRRRRAERSGAGHLSSSVSLCLLHISFSVALSPCLPL